MVRGRIPRASCPKISIAVHATFHCRSIACEVSAVRFIIRYQALGDKSRSGATNLRSKGNSGVFRKDAKQEELKK